MTAFQVMAQDQQKAPINRMVLYPEVYQFIELEDNQEILLTDLMGFCEEQELKLIQKGRQLMLLKIYPSFLEVEKTSNDLKEKIAPHAKIKSIVSYGREYLPKEYHYLTAINNGINMPQP